MVMSYQSITLRWSLPCPLRPPRTLRFSSLLLVPHGSHLQEEQFQFYRSGRCDNEDKTSLSSNYKTQMGLSQDEFSPLSRLTLGNRRCRVRVRVSRLWVASNPNNGTKFGLDALLIDDEGVTMQARALPCYMDRLQQQLVEGKVYALSGFTVRARLKNYMACRNGLMIFIEEQTVVDEIEEDTDSSIPFHSFEFIDFDDVPCRNGDNSLFTDVIGQIVSVEDMGQTWKWNTWRNITFRNLRLRDLSGSELDVVLFGDLGLNFDSEKVFRQGRQAPVIAVFAGMLVQRYAGKGFIVRSSSASKYYLDLDIPQVKEFRASLHDPHILITQLPCQQQNPVNPMEELVKSWRTIEQLKSLNPHELHKTKYLCRANLKGIDCTKPWWYWSCFHCKLSTCGNVGKFRCIQDCPDNRSPVIRYKLDAVIEDATGAMNVMIYDEQARELVGVAAEDLIEETEGDDDGSRCTTEISDVTCWCRSRVFVVSFNNGNFVVKCILNDDALQLSGLVQMAAGGSGLLSQEIGSSASYSCSSQVKEEKMVIKEESEPKPKKLKLTASEAEQTDAK
ncbi:hypothetical protein ACP70R_031191 [Stipagrostis hirtigluma subsp. patula]